MFVSIDLWVNISQLEIDKCALSNLKRNWPEIMVLRQNEELRYSSSYFNMNCWCLTVSSNFAKWLLSTPFLIKWSRKLLKYRYIYLLFFKVIFAQRKTGLWDISAKGKNKVINQPLARNSNPRHPNVLRHLSPGILIYVTFSFTVNDKCLESQLKINIKDIFLPW